MKNLLFLLIIITGCATQKKADKFYAKHPELLALKCATTYPVKDSIIKGDSVVRFDTLWETYTDTLISEPQVIIETKIVPKTVTKWVTIRDTIVRENTAKVSVLGSQIAKSAAVIRNLTEKTHELSQERDGYKEQRNDARLLNWILFVVIGIWVGLAIRKKFKIF